MRNSTRTYPRLVKRVVLLVAAVLIAAPAVQAADSGGSGGGCVQLGPSVVCEKALPQPASEPSAAGPGPGVGPVFQPNAPAAPVAVPTSGPGIDWTDAGIGAGIAIAAMLIAMATALGLRRNRRLAL